MYADRRGEILAMVNLGVKLMESDALEDAERWFERAAQTILGHGFPGIVYAAQVDAMFNLGVLLRRQGRDDEAEEWFRRAAERRDADATQAPRRSRS